MMIKKIIKKINIIFLTLILLVNVPASLARDWSVSSDEQSSVPAPAFKDNSYPVSAAADASGLLILSYNKKVSAGMKYKTYGHRRTGSTANAELTLSENAQPGTGGCLQVDYNILPGGKAGVIQKLGKTYAAGFKTLAFYIKSTVDNLKYEVYLRDYNRKRIKAKPLPLQAGEWQLVEIPMEKIDRTKLKDLEVVLKEGSGKIFIDEIFLKDVDFSHKKEEENIVIIDDFERPNPTTDYSIELRDASQLRLVSSQKVIHGSYSMQMDYDLLSSRSLGSQVFAHSSPGKTDWSDYKEFRLSILSDGSDNIFEIEITDEDGDVFSYEDKDILSRAGWRIFQFKPADLRLKDAAGGGNGEFDADNVSRLTWIVKSTRPEESTGNIWLDYFRGKSKKKIVRPRKRKVRKPPKKIQLSGSALTAYRKTPELGPEMYHEGSLIVTGLAGKFGVNLEIKGDYQTFGSSAKEIGEYRLATNKLNVEVPLFTVSANRLHKNIDVIEAGHINVRLSPHAFQPQFGYKGISVEGKFVGRPYYYTALVVKHPANGYTWGGKLSWEALGIKHNLTAVHSDQNARRVIESAIDSNGNITQNRYKEFNSERIFTDRVYLYEAEKKIGDQLTLKITQGINHFARYALADISDSFDPVFQEKLSEPLKERGTMLMGEAKFSQFPMKNFWLWVTYKRVSDKFFPFFNLVPKEYELYYSNQESINVRIRKDIGQWIVSSEYEELTRIQNRDFFKKTKRFALGHRPYHGLTFTWTQEFIEELNKHFDTRYNLFDNFANAHKRVSYLDLTYQLLSNVTLEVNYKHTSGRIQDPDLLDTPLDYRPQVLSDSYKAKLNYFFSNNVTFKLDVRRTFSHNLEDADLSTIFSDEPEKDPFADTKTEATLLINF